MHAARRGGASRKRGMPRAFPQPEVLVAAAGVLDEPDQYDTAKNGEKDDGGESPRTQPPERLRGGRGQYVCLTQW